MSKIDYLLLFRRANRLKTLVSMVESCERGAKGNTGILADVWLASCQREREIEFGRYLDK